MKKRVLGGGRLCCNTTERSRQTSLTISCETSCGFVKDQRMGAGWTLGNITPNPLNLLSLTTVVKNNQAQFNLLLNLKNSNEIGNIGEEKYFSFYLLRSSIWDPTNLSGKRQITRRKGLNTYTQEFHRKGVKVQKKQIGHFIKVGRREFWTLGMGFGKVIRRHGK